MTKWIRFMLLSCFSLSIVPMVFAQNDINVGDTIEGKANDQSHEYAIELELGQVIEITIEADWDTYLELYDNNQNLLASDDDGGDGLQSRIIFTAEETATYTIRVRAYSNDFPVGNYELSVDELDIIESIYAGELTYDDDENVDADNALAIEATFSAERGDVINIVTVSDNYLNTRLTLFDPQGNELIDSDNSYGDAQILRYEIELTGIYSFRLEESTGSILDGDIEVEVQETQILSLDDGEITFEIGDGSDMTYVNFTAVDDVVYELTMRFDEEPNSSEIAIYILEDGQALTDYSDLTARIRGGLGLSYVFEADDDGEFVVRIEYYDRDDIDVTMRIEVVEE